MQEKPADKYETLNVREIQLSAVLETNVQIGGARQAAVAPQPMHVWKFCQLKNCSPYTDDSNKFACSRVWAILKALEALKVKLSCFKGIVNPTHFQ